MTTDSNNAAQPLKRVSHCSHTLTPPAFIGCHYFCPVPTPILICLHLFGMLSFSHTIEFYKNFHSTYLNVDVVIGIYKIAVTRRQVYVLKADHSTFRSLSLHVRNLTSSFF